MRVRAIHNNFEKLNSDLQQFAFGQDDNKKIDLTAGKEYVVYGIRKNKFGKFYLVLTDEINTELPWWTPEVFFKVESDEIPASWKTDEWEGYGKESLLVNPVYFDATADIEDGTQRGGEVFKLMRFVQYPKT